MRFLCVAFWYKRKKTTSAAEGSELIKLQVLHHYVNLDLNVYNIKRTGERRGGERRGGGKRRHGGMGVKLIKVPLCTYLKMLPANCR